MANLCIEQDGLEEFGACECSGSKSKNVWGRVYRDDHAAVAYFVHWTIATSELVGRSLSRREVLGIPLAKDAFAILDAIWLQDERIAEVVSGV